MANIPTEAYNDSFLFNGVSYDPVKFVERLDMAMDAHRIEGRSHKSNVCQIPSERSEDTFEFDGHTYKHIAEHSGYTTSDVLLCDGVPNAKAWQKVINQVTAAKPGLFPLHLRPAPGLSFAEYDGGEGPVSVVEKNLDSLSDALGKFAALHGYPEGTPAAARVRTPHRPDHARVYFPYWIWENSGLNRVPALHTAFCAVAENTTSRSMSAEQKSRSGISSRHGTHDPSIFPAEPQ